MGEQFTKGPWAARIDPDHEVEWEVIKTDGSGDDPWFIALAYADAEGGSAEANAKLIASCPDLVEALRAVQGALRFQCPANTKIALAIVEAALSRATGEG